jgi:hypothetical protein
MKQTKQYNQKAFALGFLKAAANKHVTLGDFKEFVKLAVHRNDTLTYEDISSIRQQLAAEGEKAPYYDPEGLAMKAYRGKLLDARDESAGELSPHLSGAMAGLRSGALGATLAGLTGAGAGHLIHEGSVLNLPRKFTSALPTALGTTGAVAGGILAAMPAAKRRYEASKALKKLEDPNNIKVVERLNNRENNLIQQNQEYAQ